MGNDKKAHGYRNRITETERKELAERECATGYFGYNCSFKCRCEGGEACHKTTGACPRKCRKGYWGLSCQLVNSCYYNGRQESYMGTLAHTNSRSECQKWEKKVPHYHEYKPHRFPDKVYPENYCRTTTDDSVRPWCYVKVYRYDKPNKVWEYCAVKDCECPVGLFGFNCKHECHCKDITKCDSRTGICGTGCAEGWDGLSCQQENSCPPNKYGWNCEKTCQCEDPSHCTRFLGPSSACKCRPGFFNPPSCEPVTPPEIEGFSHKMLYDGESMVFICKVKAIPPLERSEILLQGPPRKRISFVDTNITNGIIRTNIFEVDSVRANERYICRARGISGNTSRDIISRVRQRPRMSRPPTVESKSDTAIHLAWPLWNKFSGDTGEGNILNYNVFYSRAGSEQTPKKAGGPYYTSCSPKCNFIIRDLSPNTVYTIFVTIEISQARGQGPPGPHIQVLTNCGPPSAAPLITKQTVGRTAGTQGIFQMTLEWEDPDKEHFGCDRIKNYILKLRETRRRRHGPSLTKREPVEVSGKVSERRYTITNLQPLTEYCVVMLMENNAELRSPETVEKCQKTEEIADAGLNPHHSGHSLVNLAQETPSLFSIRCLGCPVLSISGKDRKIVRLLRVIGHHNQGPGGALG
ncbi:hypothetical protein RRG08_055971 [Elysia crispata]|uniref:Uncharacterized protein n=1 Tax=Elysia crispata TaxID=231223 RepID=A0AAE1AGQ0_9GAST|nr:hypothetical protein RRG08_055971 [Elysia crispata]